MRMHISRVSCSHGHFLAAILLPLLQLDGDLDGQDSITEGQYFHFDGKRITYDLPSDQI